MKCYVIKTNKGYVALPQLLGGVKFPLSYLSLPACTRFPFKSAAESSVKKYRLDVAPLHGEIEEIEN